MSFKENFTRDESKDDVQYDDSAFHTFGGTMLMCFIIPLTWTIYRRMVVKNDLDDKSLKNCDCLQCKEKIQNLYVKKKAKAKNKFFYFYIILLVFLCFLSYKCYFQIKENSGNFKTFNPFEILEIQPDSTEEQIKQAYRKLARKYHPDRNPNNLQAKAKFIMLTKAYESLTDEVARKNFELYGNPDGPGSMRLAVGLPSFVLNKKNHMPILILFLIFIVIILPGFVWYWFNSTNNYDESGVQVSNHRIYYEILNENILLRQMPFVLGSSIEYSTLKVRNSEVEELRKMYRKYAELMPKHKEEAIPMGNKKAICLFYSYFDDTALTNESLTEDLNNILEIAPNLISTMYQISRQYTFLKDMQEMQMKNSGMQLDHKMMIKNFGYNCIITTLEFYQILVQKQPFKALPILQLPYLTENIVKQNKGLNKISKSLPSFLLMPDEDKKSILKDIENLKPHEIEDIITVSKNISNYKVIIDVRVEGFEEIVKDDFATLKITIIKNNLDEKLKNGLIHTNKFPHQLNEQVVVFLINNGKIVFESTIDIIERENFVENKQMMGLPGEYKFKLEVHPLNYRGMQLEQEIKINVLAHSEKRKEFMKKLEKAEPKKLEPSLFQQMINQMVVDPDDEEEEEDESEGENETETSINENKKNKKEHKKDNLDKLD